MKTMRMRCVGDFMELDMETASLHIIYAPVQGLCLSMWMALPFVRCSNKFRQNAESTIDPVNIPCQATRMTRRHRRTCPWKTEPKKQQVTWRNREKREGAINTNTKHSNRMHRISLLHLFQEPHTSVTLPAQSPGDGSQNYILTLHCSW